MGDHHPHPASSFGGDFGVLTFTRTYDEILISGSAFLVVRGYCRPTQVGDSPTNLL